MISAIVLAAGQSIRMGQSKMVLPWGKTTVIGKVVATILEAGVTAVYVVTGGNQKELKHALDRFPVKFVFNPDYENGEMIISVQIGINSLPEESSATLIVLGDQPQIENQVVKLIVERYQLTRNKIIVPSYQMHRGHPWLIDKSLWHEISDIQPPSNLHEYLIRNQEKISYVNINKSSILQDLDTPEVYKQHKP